MSSNIFLQCFSISLSSGCRSCLSYWRLVVVVSRLLLVGFQLEVVLRLQVVSKLLEATRLVLVVSRLLAVVMVLRL